MISTLRLDGQEALPEIMARAVSIDGQIHLRIYQGADLKHIGTMTASRALLLAHDLLGLAIARRQRSGDALQLEAAGDARGADFDVAAHAQQNGVHRGERQTQAPAGAREGD
jgi:hypothetical protein